MAMSGINCTSDISEQAEYTPESPSVTPAERLRALGVALKHAEAVISHQASPSDPFRPIGYRGGPDLHMRARHILDHARGRKLDARLYALAWFVYRTTREHVILDNGTSPGISGETA